MGSLPQDFIVITAEHACFWPLAIMKHQQKVMKALP